MTRTSCTTALMVQVMCTTINTLRPRQNGRYSPDNIFKYIFLNENVWIAIKISLKFVPKGPIYNIPVLVQIMAWRQQSDKPLSAPMMVILLMHICVIWPQWVNWLFIDHGTAIHLVNSYKNWYKMTLFQVALYVLIIYTRAPTQYKDRLIYVWRFPC